LASTSIGFGSYCKLTIFPPCINIANLYIGVIVHVTAASHLIANLGPLPIMRKVIIFLVSIMLASAAHSAPASTNSIETLLTAMKTEKLLDETSANMNQVIRQALADNLKGQKLTAAQQHVVDTLPTKITQIFHDEFLWSKMLPMYIHIYQESYTQEEVDGMIAFYTTPVGAKVAEKMPLVMQKTVMLLQPRMAPIMEKVKAATQQALVDIKNAK